MLQTLQKTELTWIKKNYGKNKKREVILIIRNPHKLHNCNLITKLIFSTSAGFDPLFQFPELRRYTLFSF